jgi:hypothetical protein
VQVSDKSKELYDELAKQIDAKDDAAARRLFQELLANGCSRQEIVVRVSRLIEKPSVAEKISPSPDLGSERSVISVPERLASTLRLQNEPKPTEAKEALIAGREAKQAVSAGLEVKPRPTPLQTARQLRPADC